MTTRAEDIWACEECGQLQGRHDLWFDGMCEHCHAKVEETDTENLIEQ